MSDYTLICDVNREKLVEKVNLKLFDGWETAGGICVLVEPKHAKQRAKGPHYLYAQALVKK